MSNKVTLEEFESTGDPLLDDNFEIIFSGMPSDISDGNTSLRIHTKTGVLPGTTIEDLMKEAFGYQLRYAGRKTWSGSFTVELNENHEAKMLKILRKWHKTIRKTKTATGELKKGYAAEVTFNILNNDGSVLDTTTIVGVWPSQVPDYQFGGVAQAIQCSVEFKFDYTKDDDDE